MKNTNQRSSGQALVIIAIAMMALVGMVGLAIDGANTFADRRQAQNAADSAAMAVARAFSYNTAMSTSDIQTMVINSTTANGFDNVAPRSIVTVTQTIDATACDNFTNGYYFQVNITSVVPTTFAKAVGVNTLTNKVLAKSLTCPPHPAPAGLGNALTALNPTACPGTTVIGSTQIIVNSTTNQGLFVNSGCNEGVNSSQVALSAGGNGAMTTPSVRVVGGVYGANIFAPTTVQTGVLPIAETLIEWPTFPCTGQVTQPDSVTVGGVVYKRYTPGVYPGTNSSWSNKNFPPDTNAKLDPGVYCLNKDLIIQANGRLIGSGITIVSRQGDVTFRGGNGVNISAPTADPYKGLLVFVTQSNTAGTVTINGNANLTIVGSIVAPWDLVDIKGTGDVAAPLQTQVVANTLSFGGNGTLTISYDASTQYNLPTPGQLQLYK